MASGGQCGGLVGGGDRRTGRRDQRICSALSEPIWDLPDPYQELLIPGKGLVSYKTSRKTC